MTRLVLITWLALCGACGGAVDDPGSTEPPSTGTPSGGGEAEGGANNASKQIDGANSDNPTDTPSTNGGTIPAGDDPTRLSSFFSPVFLEKGCTSGYCHAGFQLSDSDSVISAFVDVEASEPTCGRTHYVVPGSPEESILWVRVRPLTDEDVECGVVKMPQGSETGLDEESAQLIYDWIADGALP